jgi:hypothetical protein
LAQNFGIRDYRFDPALELPHFQFLITAPLPPVRPGSEILNQFFNLPWHELAAAVWQRKCIPTARGAAMAYCEIFGRRSFSS